jgi:hypothetical protein
MILVAGKAMGLITVIVPAHCDKAKLNAYFEYFREDDGDDCSTILPVRKA